MGCNPSKDGGVTKSQFDLLQAQFARQKEELKKAHREGRESSIEVGRLLGELKEAKELAANLEEHTNQLELEVEWMNQQQQNEAPSAHLVATMGSPETLATQEPQEPEAHCHHAHVPRRIAASNGDAEFARKLQREFDEEDEKPRRKSLGRLAEMPQRPAMGASKWVQRARKAIGTGEHQAQGGNASSVDGSSVSLAAGVGGIAPTARQHAGRGEARREGPVNESRLLSDSKVCDFVGELATHLYDTQVAQIPGVSRSEPLIATDEAAILASILEDCVRAIVVVPPAARHLAHVRRHLCARETELQRRQALLREKSQDEFGVPRHVVVTDGFAEARGLLTRFDAEECTDAARRLDLLLSTKNAIEAAYSRECRARGDDPGRKPLAADDFMPVFSYIVAHAEVTHLNATVQYIRDVMGSTSLGEGSYYLCMLEASLAYVMTMDVQAEMSAQHQTQMEEMQRALERNGYLQDGKFSDAIFTGQAGGALTKSKVTRRASRR